MNTQDINTNNDEPIKGQDFANLKEEREKPSSHGKVADQKGGDFSELEETRMEHPPQHREENGSEKDHVEITKGNSDQTNGAS